MKTRRSDVLVFQKHGSALVKLLLLFGGIGILVLAGFQVVPIISLQREHQAFKEAVETRIQSLVKVSLPETQTTLTEEICAILDQMKADYEPHHIQVHIEENSPKLSIQIWYSKPHSSLIISNPKPFYVFLEKTGVHIVQAPTPTPVPVEPTRKSDSMAAAPTPTPVPLETPPPTPTVTVIRYHPATPVTDKTFTQEVRQSPGPVMVFFWASWCGYCRKAAPAVDEASGRFFGKIRIVKINKDNNKLTAAKYGIKGIPAFLFFKDGKVIGRKSGFSTKQRLFSLIQEYL